MISDFIIKMKELELENDEDSQNNAQSHQDCGIGEVDEEIDALFLKAQVISEKSIATKKTYILQIAGTLENEPNVAVNLSNHTCGVYNLSNNEFAQLAVLSEHTDVISELKFSKVNSNLLYTASNDGTIRLWDLRSANSSTIQFKDTTTENSKKAKELSCFDISSNNLLLAAGTNLFEGDAYILFWDIRKYSLLGGYWESHTDDITQVKFHSSDPNKLMSGSIDGLINYYDLLQTSEDDALTDTLNTELSVEKIQWLRDGGKDVIGCITQNAEVQFWKLDGAEPYKHLHTTDIAKLITREPDSYVYIVDIHGGWNDNLLLVGSDYYNQCCLRGLSFSNNDLNPSMTFPQNKQTVRGSWFNSHTNLLLTGGEKGILNAWKLKLDKP